MRTKPLVHPIRPDSWKDSGSTRSLQPPCILVADDDALMLELIEFKLAARGYAVLTVLDGELAFANALNYRPNLIVLSTTLPVVDGFELLRRLRKDPRTRAIPIIMLTAHRQDREALSALAVGAQDFLPKPFLPGELVDRIGKLLANRDRVAR
jgi:DNA-binding response OmpR family regulator